MIALFKREPVLLFTLINSIVGTLTVFGLHLNPEQIFSIQVLTNAILAILTRQSVTPNAKVDDLINTALPMTPNKTVEDVKAKLEESNAKST